MTLRHSCKKVSEPAELISTTVRRRMYNYIIQKAAHARRDGVLACDADILVAHGLR